MGDFEKEAAEQVKYQDKDYTPRTHPKDTDIIRIGRAKWVEAVDIPEWFVKEISYPQYGVIPEEDEDEEDEDDWAVYIDEDDNICAPEPRPVKTKAK